MGIVVSRNGNTNGSHAAAVPPAPATIRGLLSGTKAAVLIGVHNALGAKIAEEAGASGMCIEDNPFPKRCSFYDGMQEDLELESTFCGKILAAIEKRVDEGFAVIARTEALIKDLGLDVALERTRAYAAAGAEGILIHHKGSDPRPVLEFADRWYRSETVPLVCVPTTYNTVTYRQLDDAGFRLVIFANYGVRSIAKALQGTFEAVMANRRLADGDEHVVPMEEVFRLIYVDELKENEARYVR